MKATRLRWGALFGLAVLGAAGCGQSFDDGMRVICQSPVEARAELAAAKDPPAKATAASVWIRDRVKNEEARSLWRSLAPLPPEGKAAKVREAAKRAGLAQCPVADIWTAS